MSAEEADKTATTDASGGDEEEEWLYGGKKIPSTKLGFYSLQRPISDGPWLCKPSQWTTGNVAAWC